MKEILDSITYSEESSKIQKFFSKLKAFNRKKNVSLIRLLKEDVFHSAFPLHDVKFKYFNFKF